MEKNAAMVCQAAQACGVTCQAPTDRRPEGTCGRCGVREPPEVAFRARKPGGVLPPI